MGRSVRSCLVAGVAVLAAGIVAVPPSVTPRTQMVTVAARSELPVSPQIDLAASVRTLAVEPPSPQKFAAAVAAIERIDPSAHRTITPNVTRALAPAPLNTASNVIESGYQFIQYWVDYGVQLSTYVLGFIPYGYLIADQINIVYFNLIRPIADSVVYQLITPVLNDPLNLASYVNGFIAVGQTSINAVINTAIAEFNNFFGWLVPPLPPLPLAVAKTVQPVPDEVVAPQAAKLQSPPIAAADPVDSEPHPAAAVDAKGSELSPPQATTTAEPETKTEPKLEIKTEPVPTTTSANGVQAQGEVRDATVGTTTNTTGETTTGETKTGDTKTGDTKTDPTPKPTADPVTTAKDEPVGSTEKSAANENTAEKSAGADESG